MFLLSLISKHGMLRMGLMMTDGSSLTISHHQPHTQILEKIESMKGFLLFFVKMKTLDYTGVPQNVPESPNF
jgi:hypothetical protein